MRRLVGDAIRGRELHIGLPRLHQREEHVKAGLIDAVVRLGSREMIYHHRHGHGGGLVLERYHQRQRGIELNVPVAAPQLLSGLQQPAPRIVGVGFARSLKVEPHAAHAGCRHIVDLALARGLIDHGDATRPRRTEFLYGVKGAGVVDPINARLHDDNAVEM